MKERTRQKLGLKKCDCGQTPTMRNGGRNGNFVVWCCERRVVHEIGKEAVRQWNEGLPSQGELFTKRQEAA